MTEESVISNCDKSCHGGLSCITHAYEMEFIKTYEQHSILWDIKHPDYTNKYKRAFAVNALLKIIKKWDVNATPYSVRRKINVLRSSYRKDLRKHLASKTIGPDGEEIYEYKPTNWKFRALKFLREQLRDDIEQKIFNNIEELNVDTTNFEDNSSEDSEKDKPLSHTNDVLENLTDGKIYEQGDQERELRKRRKLEVQDYNIFHETTLDKEFEAIGSNVTCKLKRMNADQRCYAELLINKVLITGLKNSLTDDTDLTEVYK